MQDGDQTEVKINLGRSACGHLGVFKNALGGCGVDLHRDKKKSERLSVVVIGGSDIGCWDAGINISQTQGCHLLCYPVPPHCNTALPPEASAPHNALSSNTWIYTPKNIFQYFIRMMVMIMF